MTTRRAWFGLTLVFLASVLVVVLGGIPIRSAATASDGPPQDTSLIVGRNVNVVSGTELPGGDPYLQRQNEPSIAASTRNPLHLLAGMNDYRTIDMPFEDKVPGLELGNQAIGRDAWLSIAKSFNGGQSWTTSLLPGFPQDLSGEGTLSPLKLFGTAADPVVRAGTNGLFYYAGIAFNRVDRGSGVVFVARYIDLNNKENADTIKYDGISIVDQGNSGQFLDKPWMAVDIPRPGHGHITVTGQTGEIPCGNVYVSYSAFVGKTDDNIRSKIYFKRSIDCGRTWGAAIKLSESQHTDQGTTIAIDPDTGAIYVAWRRFATASQSNAIVFVKSTDGGLTFTKPVVIRTMGLSFPAGPGGPFDQRTTSETFRTNSHPTITVDQNGTVYLAWAERQADMQAKIMLTYSTNGGMTWIPPLVVDGAAPGHQYMPSLAFAGGSVMLMWYDQRKDEAQVAPEAYIADLYKHHRHTVDVRVARIDPVNLDNASSFIHPSKQASRYRYKLIGWDENTVTLEKLEHAYTGLTMFQKGTVPFGGDYIDLTAAPVFLPTPDGEWKYNTDTVDPMDPSKPLVTAFHLAWQDTRDVKLPIDDLWPDWSLYRAPMSTQPDGQFPSPPYPTNNCDYTGMMNQNVYTACVTPGFIAFSPGNTKPLDLLGAVDDHGFPIARAFTITVKNMTDDDRAFRLTIEAPADICASFVQYFDVGPWGAPPNGFPQGFPVEALDVAVASQSTLSRPVFIYPYPADPKATVKVHVTDVTDGVTSPTSIVALNPDPTNPVIDQPDDVQQPHVKGAEVHNPHVKGVSVKNETEEYLINPHVKGLDVVNADTANPHVKGEVLNPHVKGTDVEAPHVKGESISEITWEVTNEGNTTTPYTFDTFVTYNAPNTTDTNAGDYIPPEDAVQFQLLIYKIYTTPAANGCALGEQEHHELIANIPNPHVKGPHVKGTPPSALSYVVPEEAKEATFWLNPKERALVKLYAVDPKLGNGDDFSFGETGGEEVFDDVNAEAEVTSQAHNTEDLEEGIFTLPSDTSVAPGPGMTSPLSGDFLDNGCKINPAAGSIEWDFDWTDIPGATAYHLYVLGPSATIPLVDMDNIGTSSFHLSGSGDYVDYTNLLGWICMVRAYVPSAPNPGWTGWSEVRSFNVDPPEDCPILLSPQIDVLAGALPVPDGGNFSFGSRIVGSDTDITFEIANNGNGDLTLSGTPRVSIAGTDSDQFLLTQPPVGSVAAGQSTTFRVRFLPTSEGLKTATISIVSNDLDESPYDVTLQGNAVPIGGLIALYDFGGNANDSSANGLHGTIHGTAVFSDDRHGVPSGALNFDGTTTYVELPSESSFDLNQITIIAIVKVPNFSRRNSIIAKGSNFGSFTVHIVSPDGWPYYTFRVAVGNSTYWLDNGPVPQNQYFHLASTFDAGSLQLRGYVNGAPTGSFTVQYPPLMNDQNVTIGLMPNEYFIGAIDEIRIYGGILSPAEIQALYNLAFGPFVTPLPLENNADDVEQLRRAPLAPADPFLWTWTDLQFAVFDVPWENRRFYELTSGMAEKR